MTEFEQTRLEIIKFLRGKYRLDEVAGMNHGIPCVKFRRSKKTVVSINLHENRYDFHIIFGKAEREKFEAVKHEFSAEIRELYDSEPARHGSKRLLIRVDNLHTLETVKRLLLIRKKPNQKPMAKENAVFGKCGHRCDVCVYYTGISEEFRAMLIPHLVAVYGSTDWSMRCTGCDTAGCHCCGKDAERCGPLKCLRKNRLNTCFDCVRYPCEQATVGYRQLEHKNISYDDVTWAVLPYVPYQYEQY